MSLTGQLFHITVSRTAPSTLALKSFSVSDFLHEAGFITTATVSKDDIGGTVNDTYVVKIAYPSGSIPTTATTLAAIITSAQTAITTQLGASELL